MSAVLPSRRREHSRPEIDRRSKSGGGTIQNQQSRRIQTKLKDGDNVQNQLTSSFNNLSLKHPNGRPPARIGNKKTTDEVVDISKIRRVGLKSYVRSHVLSWARTVYVSVGPGRLEKHYQSALKELLISLGLSVAKEAQWTFEQQGSSKPIRKRADLIVGLRGDREKVLLELKVLHSGRFTKADLQQVICYSDFFGIRECYLIGFHLDPIVWRLHDDDDDKRSTSWRREEISLHG
jgi:GxxExxY protein